MHLTCFLLLLLLFMSNVMVMFMVTDFPEYIGGSGILVSMILRALEVDRMFRYWMICWYFNIFDGVVFFNTLLDAQAGCGMNGTNVALGLCKSNGIQERFLGQASSVTQSEL